MRSKSLVLALLLAACRCGEAAAQGDRRGAPEGERGRSETARRDEVTAINPNDLARMQLTNVRTALKLTPEQAPAWQVYENKVVSLLDDLSRGMSQSAGVTALKQIDARVDVIRNRLTAMEDIAEAASKLYGGLSEEQKRTADRLLAGTLPALYSGTPISARRGDTMPQRR
jgi:hypothetical protein